MDGREVVLGLMVNSCPLLTRLPRVPARPAGPAVADFGEYAGPVYRPPDLIDPRKGEPFPRRLMAALERLASSMEYALLYGRQQSQGAWTLVKTHHFVDRRIAADPELLRKRLFDGPRDTGGGPDVVLLSNGMLERLQYPYGHRLHARTLIRIDAGVSSFAMPINVYEMPSVFPGATVVVDPQLRDDTAASFTSSMLSIVVDRHEHLVHNGDVESWHARVAIDVGREDWHAWVSPC